MGRNFCPFLLGIDRVLSTVNDEVVDPVFYVRARVGRAEQPLCVGLILRKEKLRRAFRVKEAIPEISMGERDDTAGFLLSRLTNGGAGDILPPGPVIAKSEGGQELERRRFRAAVMNGDPNEDILR